MRLLQVLTPLDHLSEMTGLDRLNGESYPSFVSRVGAYYNFNPNSTYFGLIWATLSQLGMGLVPYAEITTTIPSSFASVSPTGISLYNDQESLDIPLFNFYKGELVPVSGFSSLTSTINSSSTFSISQRIPIVSFSNPLYKNDLYEFEMHPFNLLFTTNLAMSQQEWINERTSYKTQHANIDPSSFTLYDYLELDFIEKKEQLADVLVPGDYFVDYEGGIIHCNKRSNSGDAFVSYNYYQWPFKLILSPIQIFKWVNDSTRSLWYNVYGQDANYKRLPFIEIEKSIAELRSINASY